MEDLSIKDFVDFANTLAEMEEVKEGKFPLPKEIVYTLDDRNHVKLQLQLHNEKNKDEEFVNDDEFTVTVFGIDFKFIKNETGN